MTTATASLRASPLARRLSAAAALALLLPPLAPVFAPAPAFGQTAAPAAPGPALPGVVGPQAGDPPARAGRLASLRGTVSTHAIDATQWSAAALNQPLTDGDALWTQPRAQASAEISASVLTMNETTELDFSRIDAQTVALAEPQGELLLHLQDLAPGETWTVLTPRGTVRLSANGIYDIEAGAADQPTLVTVLDGAADISGQGIDLHVQPNQTAALTGAGPFDGSIGAARRDPFMDALLAPARVVHRLPPGVPAYVGAMTGGDDLLTTGEWQPTPQYGTVWYPPVQAGWVPYREGHWSWVAPWGWTWVDNASWGFAPSHYGRWVDVGGRWGWTPGEAEARRDERPVYAPALVAFVGLGAAALAGAALNDHGQERDFGGGRSIGWVPLGPGEAYHPPYRVSETYLRQVNVTNVKNVTTIVNNNTSDGGAARFVNAAGATAAPVAAVAGGAAIGGVARPVSAAALAASHPLSAAARDGAVAGPAPGAAVAASLPMPVAKAGRQVMPGPVIDPALAHGMAPHFAGAAGAPGAGRPLVDDRGAGAHQAGGPGPAPGPSIGQQNVEPKAGAARQPLGQVTSGAARLPGGAARLPGGAAPPAPPQSARHEPIQGETQPRLPTVQRPTPPATPMVPAPHAGLASPVMPPNSLPRQDMARPVMPAPESLRQDLPKPHMASPRMEQPAMPRPEMARPEMPRPEMPRPEMPRQPPPRAEAPRPSPAPPTHAGGARGQEILPPK